MKEGFALSMGFFDELNRALGDVVVDGLHALFGQRAGILDGLLADAAEVRLLGWIIDIRREAMHHTAWPKELLEHRHLWIIGILRLLLGIEVGTGCRRTRQSRARWADTCCGRRRDSYQIAR